ncbi:phosphotransferase family protein [Nocardia gamkensis]|uniref:phosphotransferase family protein n=1 Tax=Nocardia gamkensis TaxID=352869 RepID=UPI0033E12C51
MTADVDIATLHRYLTGAGVPVEGELRLELISGGRSNLTYKVFDDTSTWVLRRPPVSGATPSAHDMSREYTVCRALQDTAVPVARTVVLESTGTVLGAPFGVVEYVEGQVIRDRDDLAVISKDTDAVCAALVGVLAELHAIAPEAVGLGEFGRPDGFLTRQVALWARQWERVKTRELPDVRSLHSALVDGIPSRSGASILHGDFRIDNTILDAADPTVVRAVVDWEMSTLGDPLTDVALMCVYRMQAFDTVLGTGAAWTSATLPAPDTLAHDYSRISGRDLAHWNFYLALAAFKVAVIAEGITFRAQRGSDAGNDAANAAEATPEFLAAGLRALRSGQL